MEAPAENQGEERQKNMRQKDEILKACYASSNHLVRFNRPNQNSRQAEAIGEILSSDFLPLVCWSDVTIEQVHGTRRSIFLPHIFLSHVFLAKLQPACGK